MMFFSHSVMSDSLQPHGLQHTRLPCPSLFPWVCSNSCPLSQWCYPTISSSVVPFSSCLQSFPAARSFPMNWLFASGGQSIGASASALVLPMNIQDWFPLRLTWSPRSPRDSQESFPTPQFKHISSLALSLIYGSILTSIHDYWKNHAFGMLRRFSCVRLFSTLQTVSNQAPMSMGFPRQEYWSGLLCSFPGDLPDPGIKPASLMSPELAGGLFITRATWNVWFWSPRK